MERIIKALLWVCAAAAILIPANMVWEDHSSAYDRASKAVPNMSGAQLLAVEEEAVRLYNAPADDPEIYFKALDKRVLWTAALQKIQDRRWSLEGEEMANLNTLIAHKPRFDKIGAESWRLYNICYGPTVMAHALEKHVPDCAPPEVIFQWREGLWQKCFWGFVLHFVFCLALIAFKFSEQNALTVLFTAHRFPQAAVYALASFIGVVKYDPEVTSEEVVAAAKSFAWALNSALVALLGIFGVPAVAKAQASPGGGDGGKKSGKQTRVQSEEDLPATGASVVNTAAALKQNGLRLLAVELLVGPKALSEVTAEYVWVLEYGGGKFTGYGFEEWRPNQASPSFSNNNVAWYPWKKVPAALFTEAGLKGSKPFVSSGVRLDFHRVPVVRRLTQKSGFSQLSATYVQQIGGSAPERQVIIAWGTKKLAFSGFGKYDFLKVWSEGFQRVRPGKAASYGQWQALIELFGFDKIRALIQCDVTSRLVGCSFGAKVYPMRR